MRYSFVFTCLLFLIACHQVFCSPDGASSEYKTENTTALSANATNTTESSTEPADPYKNLCFFAMLRKWLKEFHNVGVITIMTVSGFIVAGICIYLYKTPREETPHTHVVLYLVLTILMMVNFGTLIYLLSEINPYGRPTVLKADKVWSTKY